MMAGMGVLWAQERVRWALLVAGLVVAVVLLLASRPRGGSESVVVRVMNGPTVVSTQVVRLAPAQP